MFGVRKWLAIYLDKKGCFRIFVKNNIMKNLIYLAFTILLLSACQSEPTSDWEEVDLLSKGMPIKVYAPKDVEIKASDLLFDKDIVISNSEGYNLQIFMSDAYQSDLSARIKEEKASVQEMNFFKEINEEFPEGFTFTLSFDSLTVAHDFRYIQLKGDKEYVMQMGLGTIADVEDVEATIKGIKKSTEPK